MQVKPARNLAENVACNFGKFLIISIIAIFYGIN